MKRLIAVVVFLALGLGAGVLARNRQYLDFVSRGHVWFYGGVALAVAFAAVLVFVLVHLALALRKPKSEFVRRPSAARARTIPMMPPPVCVRTNPAAPAGTITEIVAEREEWIGATVQPDIYRNIEPGPYEVRITKSALPKSGGRAVWVTPFMTQMDSAAPLFREERKKAIDAVRNCLQNPRYETEIGRLIAAGTIRKRGTK